MQTIPNKYRIRFYEKHDSASFFVSPAILNIDSSSVGELAQSKMAEAENCGFLFFTDGSAIRTRSFDFIEVEAID